MADIVQAPPPPSAVKQIAALTVIACIGILIALIMVELLVRLFLERAPVSWHDRPMRYFIHERSTTFQDYPVPQPKAEGTYRIAVVGDSFTFAPFMQFDDAFPKRLERWLNLNDGQRKVEVINYGVPAHSAHHELHTAAKAIDEQADLVLMQITLNDPELKPYTPQELTAERNRFGALQLPDRWIFRHWHSLVFVLRRLHNNQTHKNYVEKFFDLFEEDVTWSSFRDSWIRIGRLKNKRGVPIVAVVFPLFGVPVDDDYPFWPLHQKVSRLLEKQHIPLLDISEAYRNIPVERLQVLPGEDFHPNEIAHRMAAEAIVQWLGDNAHVPAEILPKVWRERRIGIRLER
jgi:lysophospholipase L1-like esterase